MLHFVDRILNKIQARSFRSFQKEILTLKGTLSKQEEDILLSGMWQNQAFRNFIVTRETAIVLAMANEGRKPTDDEYLELYGRRKELKDLYIMARNAFHRQEILAKEQKKTSKSPQALA